LLAKVRSKAFLEAGCKTGAVWAKRRPVTSRQDGAKATNPFNSGSSSTCRSHDASLVELSRQSYNSPIARMEYYFTSTLGGSPGQYPAAAGSPKQFLYPEITIVSPFHRHE